MTANELIAILARYPADTRVVIAGYEDGYNDITYTKEIQIVPDTSKRWYEGAHADAEDFTEPANTASAIFLGGENQNAED